MSPTSPRLTAPACFAMLAAGLACAPAAYAAACSGPLRFEAEYFVTPIAYAKGVAPGDWNEDGKVDVAVASVAHVTVLLGEGDFRWGARTEMPFASTPRWIAARDMDGDGHLDLVVTGDGGTVILAGDGAGRFHETEAFAEAGSHVTVGDLDGDARPDIVLAPLRDQPHPAPYVPELSVILRGTGERHAIPGGVFFSALADLDQDGDLDLVSYAARVWLNDGHARFSGPTSYSSECADHVAVGDVDGDGRPDLFGVGGGQYACDRILLGNGDGTFRAGALAPSASVIGPEDGPTPGGDPQEPARSSRHVPQGPGFVVLADLDGDGKADPVRIGMERGRELNGRRSISGAQMACVADLDGDAKPDVVVAGFGGIAIHPGNGDGTFRSNLSTAMDYPPGDLQLADFDGDGRRDVAVTGYDGGQLVIALTAPDGGIKREIRNQISPGGSRIAIADLDGDERVDLLDEYDGVYFGNGDGTFRGPPIPTAAFGIPGDFNEDGHMDLADPEVHAVQIHLGNGDGTFASGPTIAVGALNLQVADMDQDGHLDIVASALATGIVSVVYGRGDGTAAEIVRIPTGAYYLDVSVGDLDGDGLMDLIAPSPTGMAIHQGRGRTFVRSPYAGAPPGAVIGDVNGDGDADLVAGGVWLGHGDGTFDPPDVLLGPGGATRVADRNGDGLADLVIAGSDDEDGDQNTVTVIMNRTARNRAPVTAAARAGIARSWPPSGVLAEVAIDGITDLDGDPVTIACTGVTQDEPVSGAPGPSVPRRPGRPGAVDADAIIDPDGHVRVRVARDGSGNGRVYEIAYRATDACGGTSLGRVSLCVPHRPGDACVDDGQRYDSLGGSATMVAGGAPDDPTPLAVRSAPGGGFAIHYSLEAPAEMRLEVFDLSGRRVASLESGRREAGAHEVAWTPSAPHGVYFVRLTSDGQRVIRRFVALP